MSSSPVQSFMLRTKSFMLRTKSLREGQIGRVARVFREHLAGVGGRTAEFNQRTGHTAHNTGGSAAAVDTRSCIVDVVECMREHVALKSGILVSKSNSALRRSSAVGQRARSSSATAVFSRNLNYSGNPDSMSATSTSGSSTRAARTTGTTRTTGAFSSSEEEETTSSTTTATFRLFHRTGVSGFGQSEASSSSSLKGGAASQTQPGRRASASVAGAPSFVWDEVLAKSGL